ESEGRPEGKHDEHWSRAHQNFAQDKGAAETSGETPDTASPKAGDTPPADTPAEAMDTQDKAMMPGNGAESLSRTAKPEPGSEPTPPAKRPRTQRKKTPAT
ncbi:MAG: hypothetical protein JWN07_1412, partial [Hyphomicrobiales bacterium]|nr:hypothetical protein [Hyphomicrobiales bacterium]